MTEPGGTGKSVAEGKYRGLTTIAARRALVAVTHVCLADLRAREEARDHHWARSIARDRNLLGLVGTAVLFVISYIILAPREPRPIVQLLVPAVLVLASVALAAFVKAVYLRCWTEEVRRRLEEVLRDYRAACERAERQLTEPQRPRRGQAASPLLQGSPQVAIVSAYRDGQWQRVPKLLLAAGDVVALMAGDAAPAAAELLQFDNATLAALGGSEGAAAPAAMAATAAPAAAAAAAAATAAAAPEAEEAAAPEAEAAAAAAVPVAAGMATMVAAQTAAAAAAAVPAAAVAAATAAGPAAAATATAAAVGPSSPLGWDASGAKVAAGERIQLRPGAQLQFARRALVPATSPTLLVLCGDMRCFRLLETPLVAHLRQAVVPPSVLHGDDTAAVTAAAAGTPGNAAALAGGSNGGGGGGGDNISAVVIEAAQGGGHAPGSRAHGGGPAVFGTPARKESKAAAAAAAAAADPGAATTYQPTMAGVPVPPHDPPEPLLSRRLRLAAGRVAVGAAAATAGAMLAGAGRLAFCPPSRGAWPVYLLVQPAALLLCLLPISVAAWVAAAEAALTARLLVYFEMALRQRRGRLAMGRAAADGRGTGGGSGGKRDSIIDVVAGVGSGVGGGSGLAGISDGGNTLATSSVALAATTPARPDSNGEGSGAAEHLTDAALGPAASLPQAALRPAYGGGFEEAVAAAGGGGRATPSVVTPVPGHSNGGNRGSPALTPPYTPEPQRGASAAATAAGAPAGGLGEVGVSDDEFDEFDVDERQRAVSAAEVSVSLPRFLAYFKATWRHRWGFDARPDPASSAAPGDGNGNGSRGTARGNLDAPRRWWQWWSWRQRRQSATAQYPPLPLPTPALLRAPLLPVPLLRCRALERLGASTMLAFLDEDTICEPHSTAKEIFLLDGKEDRNVAGSGGGGGGDSGGAGARRTVLDLHSRAGISVGFDDPRWWVHLPALKPVGLTCLLAESRGGDAHGRGSAGTRRPPAGGGVSGAGGGSGPSFTGEEHGQRHWRRPDKALLDHVRQSVPMEHLKRLAREIGFCDADRGLFRERRRIHVINPRLAAHRAMEDAHAQGQEETRRRGTIQPHVQGVVVEDRRTRALQLLCNGNPPLLLGMCADYWDGGTISPIPQPLRRMVLDMHQQWSLEDLDVVAFGYTPVPYTVQPLVSTHSKTPEYLVWAREAAPMTRGRRGTPTGEQGGGAVAAAAAVAAQAAGGIDGRSPDMRPMSAAEAAMDALAAAREERLYPLRPALSSPSLALAPVAELEATAIAGDGGGGGGESAGGGGGGVDLGGASGPGGGNKLGNESGVGNGGSSRDTAPGAVVLGSPTNGSSDVSTVKEGAIGNADADVGSPVQVVHGSPDSSVGRGAAGSAASEPDAFGMLSRLVGPSSPGSVKSSPGPILEKFPTVLPTSSRADPPRAAALGTPAAGVSASAAVVRAAEVEVAVEGGRTALSRSRGASDTAVGSSALLQLSMQSEGDLASLMLNCSSPGPGRIGTRSATASGAGSDLLDTASGDSDAGLAGRLGSGGGGGLAGSEGTRPAGAVAGVGGSSLLQQAVRGSTAAAAAGMAPQSPGTAVAGPPSAATAAVIEKLKRSRRFSIDDFGVPRMHHRHHHHSRHHHGKHRHYGIAQGPARGPQGQRRSHVEGRLGHTPLAGNEGMDGRGDGVASALWNLMHEQVFLGMVASSVAPKREVPSLIEDVMACAVRFVYFSPRNMRRSKALAEDMGIETDWNCAISLRTLEEPNTPDPHRMITEYADWDVKARLPHGIAAIKEHIRRVDNVPLLVSLFTDATPDAVHDMLRVSQEHAESIMAVGSAGRASNARLLRQADLSLSQDGLPANQSMLTLPSHAPTQLSAADVAFNGRLVGLFAALPLGGDATRRAGGVGEAQAVLIDLVREGRRLLNNITQAVVFWLTACASLALLVLLGAALPVSRPPQLFNLQLLWLLWLVVPLLAASLLTAAADSGLMRRAPEKNQDRSVEPARRHAFYLLVRAAPAAVGAIALYPYLFGSLLVQADEEMVAMRCSKSGSGGSASWSDAVWCPALAHDSAPESAWRASSQATDLALCEAVLCLAAQAAGFLHRTAPLRHERAYRNCGWAATVALALFLQAIFVVAASATRQSLDMLGAVPWPALLAGALWPAVALAVGEAVKRHDAKAHGRYVTLLRLEFETRLGMYSPR